MQNLFEYLNEILEDVGVRGGFVNLIDLDELGQYLQSRNKKLQNEDIPVIIKGISSLIEQAEKDGLDVRILGSQNANYVKIPYGMIPYIQNLPATSDDDIYQVPDPANKNKYNIYYKKVKLAETGSGSYGRKSLDKEIHENLSAIYFNTPEDRWGDLDAVVSELYSFADMKLWCASFRAQASALQGVFGDNFRAVRIDNEANIKKVYNEVYSKLPWKDSFTSADKQVNEIYNELSNTQKNFLLRANPNARIMREHYDKSDIILYDPSKLSKIKKLTDLDKDEIGDVKTVMVELYRDKALIGISLKGLSSPANHFELVSYNTDNDPENGVVAPVESFEFADIGRFRGGKFNIQNGWSCSMKHKDGTRMEMEFRSFGKSPALEVKFLRHPALGKSPIFLWRKFVEEYSKKEPIGTANPQNIRDVFTGELYNNMAKRYGWKAEVDDNQKFNFENYNVATVVGLQFLYSLHSLSDQEICDNLTTWARAACADADYAFPFILTKEA